MKYQMGRIATAILLFFTFFSLTPSSQAEGPEKKEPTGRVSSWEAFQALKGQRPDYKTLSDMYLNTLPKLSSSKSIAAVPGNNKIFIPAAEVGRDLKLQFRKGISVLMYKYFLTDSQYAEEVDLYLNKASSLGVNSITLVVPFFMDSASSNTVYTLPDKTESKTRLSLFAQKALNRGIEVHIRLLLDEANLYKEGKWRGLIEPQNRNEWFKNYTALLLDYANFARDQKIAILTIGSELSSLENENVLWIELINALKAVYKGKLVYTSNWDRTVFYARPAFKTHVEEWIDPYFPLENVPDVASVDQLIPAWNVWFTKMEQNGYQLNTLTFAEIGIVPQMGAYAGPYGLDNGKPLSYEVQKSYFESVCRVAKERGVKGIYWWITSVILPGRPNAYLDRFNFIGNPAEGEVLKCFNS